MRSKWIRIGWVVLFLSMIVGSTVMASSLFGTRFNLGEDIQFEIEDSTSWWFGCCPCPDSLVLGWRIANASHQVIYSVIHDAPVSAAVWRGEWQQHDMNGIAVAAGQYKLYVDTSVGTLSRCFTLWDPCACNWFVSRCTPFCCEHLPVITTCACSTSLVFVADCQPGCFPFFWWGRCLPRTSPGCSTCP